MKDSIQREGEAPNDLAATAQATSGADAADGTVQGPSEAELAELRAQLTEARGPAFWEKLESLSGTPGFQAFRRRWFPSQAPSFGPAMERRQFLRRMGGSLAVAGLGACTRQPDEIIVPQARTPEALIPGKPRYFATALPTGSDVIGVLVESHMGRPTKIEGNPEHPASLGSTDTFAQASILGLYDPDRSHSVLRAGQISTWDSFVTELRSVIDGAEAARGEGLAVLVEDNTSPTLHAELEALRERLPAARVHHWTPLHRNSSRRFALDTFGRDVVPRYAFERADIVVSLDADFLASGMGGVRYARDFSKRRRVRQSEGDASMNRLYAIESTVTVTGAMADHRLAIKPSRLQGFAQALAQKLGLGDSGSKSSWGSEDERRLVKAIADDLAAHEGTSLVVAGEGAGPEVHAWAHAMNQALGNVGATVDYIDTPAPNPTDDDAFASLQHLTQAIERGEVRALAILGGNPVYDAPAELHFADALPRVDFRVHLSLHVDETSRLCEWHIPMAHSLEGWGDARAFDGTASIVQPLIAPLYGGKTAIELVASLRGEWGATAYDRVRAFWQAETGLADADFEALWQTSLHDGLVPNTRFEAVDVVAAGTPEPDAKGAGAAADASQLELAIRPDASVFDGRFANNGWLQEAPRPLTRLTWDNVVMVSPATADELGVDSEDVVRLTVEGRSVEGPAWVTPAHPDGSLTVHLGYGREHAGQMGSGVGFDAYPLRGRASWHRSDVTLEKVGRTAELASVQDHASMEGRDLAKVATLADYQHDPSHAIHHGHDVEGLSMYPGYAYEGYAWGMVIDLNSCIGCNACMVACQSENNIPVVGKEEVAMGREMHWIRVDRYYEEEENGDTRALHQPVPCMHCEEAPCEVVCPVGATVHGNEGLNEMVYNRCVGTRYCSNNCPYKVRRFNFFGYADYETESLKLANNPDVTVRARGVMEKCTYCVQRINHARIEAKKDDRTIADGEVQTACMQVCPAQAITFGDINDPKSAVAKDREEPLHYGLLEEVGTRPRTTYLAKVTNPNPELDA